MSNISINKHSSVQSMGGDTPRSLARAPTQPRNVLATVLTGPVGRVTAFRLQIQQPIFLHELPRLSCRAQVMCPCGGLSALEATAPFSGGDRAALRSDAMTRGWPRFYQSFCPAILPGHDVLLGGAAAGGWSAILEASFQLGQSGPG